MFTKTECLTFGEITITLQIPDPQSLLKNATTFYAKLWPSAIALAEFITTNPAFIANKNVLELAAGLGLPGMVAAHIASEVTISDYIPEAVELMKSSVVLNGLTNVRCELLDWYNLPTDLTTDVLLLSDINYDPEAFEVLYQVLGGFLASGTTIILATPQRLMAKPFIERLLAFCTMQEEVQVSLNSEQTFITILVLKNKAAG